jgi:hypothetical protein
MKDTGGKERRYIRIRLGLSHSPTLDMPFGQVARGDMRVLLITPQLTSRLLDAFERYQNSVTLLGLQIIPPRSWEEVAAP